MNVFQVFLSFSQYLGTTKAFIMVFAFFLGDFIIKKAPAALEARQKEGSKLANFLLFDFRSKKCPRVYENY